MTAIYTYSEARQNLASLLDLAVTEGEVRIRRREGQIFTVRLEPVLKSPLDIEDLWLRESEYDDLGIFLL